MAEMGEVHTNLMGATGFELDPQQRTARQSLLDTIVGHRLPPVLTHGHAGALATMASDWGIDQSAAAELTEAKREIFPLHFTGSEMAYQHRLRLGCARHQHQARRIFVEAMHDASARYAGEFGVDGQQRILQGALAITRPGMHHEPGWFIDNPEAGIGVSNGEGYGGFTRTHLLIARKIRLYPQTILRLDALTAARLSTLDLHSSGVNPALQARAGILWQEPREHEIEAHALHLRRHGQVVNGRQFACRAAGQGGTRGCRSGSDIMHVFTCGIPTTMTAQPSRDPARRTAWRVLALLALATALLPLSACRSNRGDEDRARGAPEVVYERAKQQLNQQDFNSAIRTYEALIARYPFAAEARQASLDLIYAYYRGREPESALDQADTFIRENPTHPRIDYAYYLKGLTDFERSANFLERWFNVDLDARPPQTARSSYNSFRKVVEDFPRSDYAHDARRRMIHLRNRLADYEIYVARYYQRREAWVGASQRAKAVLEQYDGAPAVREALEILIESYEALGMTELANQSREVYAFNYGGIPTEVVPVKKSWWKLWN